MYNEKIKLHDLGHLKGIAIFLVLMFPYLSFSHPQWANTFSNIGFTVVDLFFVISWFLIVSQSFA
jgi:peptidoglycan/LPS O-acetylase OafA/YrhL